MMGLPDGWVCDVPISRNAQLKALGNGVVPAQAEAALRWLLGGQVVGAAGGDELLGTPTAHERTHTPRAVDHGRQLANQVALLPTPSVADGMGGHLTRSGDRSDELLLPGVAKSLALLPTPEAHESGSTPESHLARKPGRTKVTALNIVAEHLLPPPAVNDMGAGKTPEQWDEWTDAMKARHGNGNGHGPSLAIEAQRIGGTP